MKKLLLTLFTFALSFTLPSCNINEDYDLSNIDGGDFVLGDEESVFNLPLATVTITSTNCSKARLLHLHHTLAAMIAAASPLS